MERAIFQAGDVKSHAKRAQAQRQSFEKRIDPALDLRLNLFGRGFLVAMFVKMAVDRCALTQDFSRYRVPWTRW